MRLDRLDGPEIADPSPVRDGELVDEVAADERARMAVRSAIRQRMRTRGYTSAAALADDAGVSYNAVNEFLTGVRRWPRAGTRAAIEGALGWEPRTMDRLLGEALRPVAAEGITRTGVDRSPGLDPTSPEPPTENLDVVLSLPSGALEGLSEAEVREITAAAELAALERMREITRAAHSRRSVRDEGTARGA
jgi:hypothetical protein